MNILRRLLVTLLASLLMGLAFAQDGTSASFFAPNRWAVVIGASEYDELGKLDYAASDAEAFARSLISEYQFEPEKVKVLTDQREKEAEKPTVEHINATLDAILADPRLGQGDLLMFYFSGHGVGAGGTDLLLPTDATFENYAEVGLPVKTIIERVAKSGVRNVVFVADACRSGSSNPFGTELVQLGREANIAVILGCEPGGESYELPSYRMGAMTYSLIEAMKDRTLADRQTGALWISTLAEKVQERVQTETAREKGEEEKQVPSVYCRKNQDILIGGFVGRSQYGPELAAYVQEQGRTLDQEVYARLLHGLALAAMEAGQPQPAVDALRTVRELGWTWGGLLAMEAVSLGWMGREAESEALFERLVKEFPEDYHAYLYRSLYTDNFEERRKAAQGMWDKFKDVNAGMALMMVERNDPSSTDAERGALAGRLAQAFEVESGPWIFFMAYQMGLTTDPNELLENFDPTMAVELDGVRREYAELLLFEVAQRTGDPQTILEILAFLMQNPVTRQVWEMLERPYVVQVTTPENRAELGKLMLEGDGTGERLWTAVCVWGDSAGDYLETIEDAAKKRPFSVRAQSALFFAKLMAEKPDTFVIPEELRVLGMDKPNFLGEFYKQITLASNGGWTFLKPSVGYGWNCIAMTDLIAHPDPFDPTWLEAYAYAAIRLEREDLLVRLGDLTIKEPPTSLLWLELVAGSFLLDDRPEEALKAVRLFGDSPAWEVVSTWAMLEGYYRIKGLDEKAREVKAEREKLGLALPEDVAAALAAVEAALKGDKAAIGEAATKIEGALPMDFLNWAQAKAGVLTEEELASFVFDGRSAYPWVHAELYRILGSRVGEEARDYYNVQLLARPELCFANIPFSELTFDPKASEVELFGTMLWEGESRVDVTAKVTWKDGQAVFTLVRDGVSTEFKGPVTSNGYVDAVGEFRGQTVNLRIRIAPAEWWSQQIFDLSIGYLMAPEKGWGALNLQVKQD